MSNPRLKTESQINAFNQRRTIFTISHKLVYTVMAKSFETQIYIFTKSAASNIDSSHELNVTVNKSIWHLHLTSVYQINIWQTLYKHWSSRSFQNISRLPDEGPMFLYHRWDCWLILLWWYWLRSSYCMWSTFLFISFLWAALLSFLSNMWLPYCTVDVGWFDVTYCFRTMIGVTGNGCVSFVASCCMRTYTLALVSCAVSVWIAIWL